MVPTTDPAVPGPPATFYARFVKRACDVVLSLVAIAIALPIMALTGLAVLIVLGPPVLFRDERAGLGGRPLRIAKFRSMSDARNAGGSLAADSIRLGSFGRFLRRTSLDELPQLFNVLAGDMSLVGPRPLPLRYVSRYNARQAARLLVAPGLTGWAQIHGRNAVDWPQRLEYDAQYVERLGRPGAWRTDLWIVVATAFQILTQAVTGRGIAGPGAVTMKEFNP